jgi:putative flippase GtrA
MLNFIMIGAGGAAAFVALSSLVIALPTGLENWIVNALCYGALIGPVYLLHRQFSFHSDVPHLRALPRYLAVQASALALATLFGFVLHGVFAMPSVAASTLVVMLTSGGNYLVLRSWAFARVQLGGVVPA